MKRASVYGGFRREAGQAMEKSGDDGIDGIIKEDKLGLDVIYEIKKIDGDYFIEE